MSASKDQEYFADGLSEELLNLLAKTARAARDRAHLVVSFKGRNDESAGDWQEAQRRAHPGGQRAKVRRASCALPRSSSRAADGSHLWSETYDRTLDDIFVVQDEIAGEVVKALKVTLAWHRRSRHVPSHRIRRLTTSPCRGVTSSRGAARRTSSVQSIYFRRSLERDPEYAPAWAGLSRAYAYQADVGLRCRSTAGYRRAREAAEKALALDPQLADAHLAMGWIHTRLRLGLGGRGRQLLAEHWRWNPATPWPSVTSASMAMYPRTLGRSDRRDKQGHRARSAAAEFLHQPRPHLAWQSTATRRPRPRFAGPWNSIPTEPSAFGDSGGPCSCRARPTPPCGKYSRKRTRAGGSQDCRSYITRSVGAASPTRRWRF